MNDKFRKVLQVVIIVCILLLLIPVLWISRYNHPSADDFWYGSYYTRDVITSKGGIFALLCAAVKTTQVFLESWQGIYSSGVVLSLHPGIFGEKYYTLTTLFLILCLYVGLFFFVKYFFKAMEAQGGSSWLVAAVLAFFFVETLPSPVQGLYWFNGSTNYLFFTSVLLGQIALLFSLNFENSRRARVLKVICGTLLVIFIEGGNHVTAFAGVLIMLGFVGYDIFVRKKLTEKLLFLAVGSVCFAMNLLSPGTALRLHEMGYQGSMRQTMLASLRGALDFIIGWRSWSLLCLALLLVLLLYPVLQKAVEKKIFSWKAWLVSLALSFGLFCAMLCVPYQAMGNFGAWRVLNVDYLAYELFVFLHLFYGLGCLIGRKDTFRTAFTHKIKGTSGQVSICLLAVCLLAVIGIKGGSVRGASTSLDALRQLASGEAQQYDREMNERLKLYLDDSLKEVYVQRLSVKPDILFFDDLEESPDDWRNQSVARYYHKDFVAYAEGAVPEK